MQTQSIEIGDKVRHRTRLLNGNVPMAVSKIESNQALCDHFEPDENGDTIHKQSWFPFDELEKINFGNS